MNDIVKYIKLDGEFALSSLEIAEACGKRHDNVMRDIKKQLDKLGEAALKFEGSYVGADNTARSCYFLPFDLMITVVTGYDVVRRKKVIDRWMELEKEVVKPQAAKIDMRDPLQLTQVAIQLIQVNQELQDKVAQMLPEVQAYERIAVADGSHCLRDTAKTLRVREKDLIGWLREKHWIYSRPGNTRAVAYADSINKGYLEHKVVTVSRSDGSELQVSQVRVTPKGLNVIARHMEATPSNVAVRSQPQQAARQ